MNQMVLNFIIGILISIIAVTITLKKKALTIPAAIVAAVFVMIICLLSSWIDAFFLVVMYFIVFVIDMKFHKKGNKSEVSKEKGTARKLKQILVNGSAGLFLLICAYLTRKEGFRFAYYATVLEVMADSIASDVGVLSKEQPWDILTRKKVICGMSGGVSWLGLAASAVICLIGGGSASIINSWGICKTLILIITSYAGMLLDSILGSVIQVKYKCCNCGIFTEQLIHCGQRTLYHKGIFFVTNDIVNLICTSVVGLTACFIVL